MVSLNDPLYYFKIASAVHVAAASTLFWDLYNANTSKVVRVLQITPIPDLETAVTGVGFEWQILRTTSIGTTGTAQTAWLADTQDAALPADITCRLKAGGGATASTSLLTFFTHSEEGSAVPTNMSGSGVRTNDNVVPYHLSESGKGIVVNPDSGLRCNQETNSAAGNTAWLIGFTVEST